MNTINFKTKSVRAKAFLAVSSLLVLAGCGGGQAPSPGAATPVRVGYFQNITHSQAVIGMADGSFQKALGGSAKVEAKVFNAGPSVIEAVFAGQIDLAYIGPNPAINGYVKSNGVALKIIAGATSGGAVLVVRDDAGIKTANDFRGKKIASPQLGNTQDVALKAWLQKQGIKLKEVGGDTQVIPTANPDIITLFRKKEIDAAWVPEPWGARLVREAGGKVFLDERDLWERGEFSTTVIIASGKFLKEHPDLVKAFLAAHVELTQRINANPADAKTMLNTEIERLTGAKLAPEILDEAWGRQKATYEPLKSAVFASAKSAFSLGFLGDSEPDLQNLFDLSILNSVLQERGFPKAE